MSGVFSFSLYCRLFRGNIHEVAIWKLSTNRNFILRSSTAVGLLPYSTCQKEPLGRHLRDTYIINLVVGENLGRPSTHSFQGNGDGVQETWSRGIWRESGCQRIWRSSPDAWNSQWAHSSALRFFFCFFLELPLSIWAGIISSAAHNSLP